MNCTHNGCRVRRDMRLDVNTDTPDWRITVWICQRCNAQLRFFSLRYHTWFEMDETTVLLP